MTSGFGILTKQCSLEHLVQYTLNVIKELWIVGRKHSVCMVGDGRNLLWGEVWRGERTHPIWAMSEMSLW